VSNKWDVNQSRNNNRKVYGIELLHRVKIWELVKEFTLQINEVNQI